MTFWRTWFWCRCYYTPSLLLFYNKNFEMNQMRDKIMTILWRTQFMVLVQNNLTFVEKLCCSENLRRFQCPQVLMQKVILTCLIEIDYTLVEIQRKNMKFGNFLNEKIVGGFFSWSWLGQNRSLWARITKFWLNFVDLLNQLKYGSSWPQVFEWPDARWIKKSLNWVNRQVWRVLTTLKN